MQILHPFAGSLQQYTERLADPDCYRPGHCPQCHAKQPLTAHGFYTRTLIDAAFDGVIRVRRYLCHACRRTVSLLPEFILPYLRSSLMVIALFLVARLLSGQTIEAAAAAAPHSPPPQRPSEPPHTPFAWNREAFRRKLPSRRKDTRWTTKPKKSRSFVTG